MFVIDGFSVYIVVFVIVEFCLVYFCLIVEIVVVMWRVVEYCVGLDLEVVVGVF